MGGKVGWVTPRGYDEQTNRALEGRRTPPSTGRDPPRGQESGWRDKRQTTKPKKTEFGTERQRWEVLRRKIPLLPFYSFSGIEIIPTLS